MTGIGIVRGLERVSLLELHLILAFINKELDFLSHKTTMYLPDCNHLPSEKFLFTLISFYFIPLTVHSQYYQCSTGFQNKVTLLSAGILLELHA